MTLIPIQVTFLGFVGSELLDAEIREHVAWLEQFHEGIVRCRVLVELPHRHRHGGLTEVESRLHYLRSPRRDE